MFMPFSATSVKRCILYGTFLISFLASACQSQLPPQERTDMAKVLAFDDHFNAPEANAFLKSHFPAGTEAAPLLSFIKSQATWSGQIKIEDIGDHPDQYRQMAAQSRKAMASIPADKRQKICEEAPLLCHGLPEDLIVFVGGKYTQEGLIEIGITLDTGKIAATSATLSPFGSRIADNGGTPDPRQFYWGGSLLKITHANNGKALYAPEKEISIALNGFLAQHPNRETVSTTMEKVGGKKAAGQGERWTFNPPSTLSQLGIFIMALPTTVQWQFDGTGVASQVEYCTPMCQKDQKR